jgi:AcrR family transcriptional regulator
MRVKTEERRQAILEKAYEVFREAGFDRASMSEIAKRVGGSKATLYSYFSSKEELFTAAMRTSPEVGDIFNPLADPNLELRSAQDLREILERFGIAYLTLSLTPDIIGMRRNMIAQGDRSDISKQAFEAGPMQSLMMVAMFLNRAMSEALLRKTEPWVAMVHFIALIESEIVTRRLLGIIKNVPPEMIRDAALRAVDVFLRAYGSPEPLG